ncbi:flippase [Budviciaceae bacterium BWR-B9]|uniref:Flippase n=1 Tax=Limnobaculum allomyrinae TaxID=2791986 RepID=A0ABS1ITG4_9GAMM|nr:MULTISPECIES: flippase [Limnobaculum]MBK5145044.1 flippase [Limnobaculum allomyrinae]MBV7692875.1 flippase [Limnobaculum sp. M2-1]
MSLIRNSILNIGGYILPGLISIPALGYMARVMGMEKFGIFTLALSLVGYASIFDAGLTRAVVREISINRNNIEVSRKIISTATLSLLALGFLGFFIIIINASFIVNILNVSSNIVDDVKFSIYILALTVPIFLLNQLWFAILEGKEQFVILNVQKSISGSLVSGLPAIFILYNNNIIYAMLALLISRIVSLMVTFFLSKKIILSSGTVFDYLTFKRLISFGGWITVSNIISPIMAYFDRFVVSHFFGANNVANYSAPSEGISRLLIIPGALARAIFPKLSYSNSHVEKNRNKRIAYILICICCFPIVFIGCYFSEKIMLLWMGPEFIGTPVIIFQILLFGYFFNSLAHIPFASIQASGYARWTAIVHILELLPYIILLYLCIDHFGIIGAAIAWSLRVTFDFILLLLIDNRLNSNL